jgi:hypothetical protein
MLKGHPLANVTEIPETPLANLSQGARGHWNPLPDMLKGLSGYWQHSAKITNFWKKHLFVTGLPISSSPFSEGIEYALKQLAENI